MNIFDINLEYSLFDVIISIILFVLSFVAFFYFGYFRDLKERVKEIQGKIKKSREHTSRLLKKLYSENIVIRDETMRPFRYKITNEGRKLLEQTTSSPG